MNENACFTVLKMHKNERNYACHKSATTGLKWVQVTDDEPCSDDGPS